MPAESRTRHVAVVINTASRTGAAALRLVEAELRRSGVEEVDVHRVDGGTQLPGALAEAVGA
jgi:diacylglycerol kinase (ATP)